MLVSSGRARGPKGLLLALAMAGGAGLVQGALSWRLESLGLRVLAGAAMIMVVLLAGIVSARGTRSGAVLTGLAIACVCLCSRWALWLSLVGAEAMPLPALWWLEGTGVVGVGLLAAHVGYEEVSPNPIRTVR